MAMLMSVRREASARSGDVRWRGAGIMSLLGVALQIKYSILFEGVFADVVLLCTGWRNGRAPVSLALDAALWVSLALLPTALAAGSYAAICHLHEWIFANIVSITERGA